MMQDTPLANLHALLTLVPVGRDSFVGDGKYAGLYNGSRRRYGGELLAQALRAAQLTVANHHVHSLHAYFIRPASVTSAVLYHVERSRDGARFTNRRVSARQSNAGAPDDSQSQRDALVFTLDASFAADAPGFAHQVAMPAVPPPEALPTEAERMAQARSRHDAAPSSPENWYEQRCSTPGPFEFRCVEDLWQPGTFAPQMHTWVRTTATISDIAMSAAMALYYSDDPIMDNALLPHVGRDYSTRLQTASLDHAMWFHRPFAIGDWHLFAQDSPIAHGARGLTRGHWFNRVGQLVATVAQEVLIRPSATPLR